MKRLLTILVLLCLVVSVVACSPSGDAGKTEPSPDKSVSPNESGDAEPEPIIIGQIVTAMTGNAAMYGDYIVNSAQMAADEINVAGGVNGRKIKIVYLDDQSDSTVALQCMQKLLDEYDCAAIIGPDWSGNTMATLPVSSAAGMPQLTTSKARKITHQEGVDNIFRMVASGHFVGEALVQAAMAEGHKKVAIMCTNSEYGLGGGEGAKKAAEDAGLEVVAFETHNEGDIDFTAQWTNIINAKPDCIISYSIQVEGAKSLKQLREMGSTIPVFGGDAFITPDFAALVGDEYMQGVIAASAYVACAPQEKAVAYTNKYKELFGEIPDDHGSAYYDAVLLLGDVMKEYGTEHEKIIEGLGKVKDWEGCQGIYFADEWGNLVHTCSVVEYTGNDWKYIFTTDPIYDFAD